MKRNSWHYKLAKVGNDNMTIWDMSICEYIRCVIWGGVLMSAITALLSTAVGWLLLATYEIIRSLTGTGEIGPAAIMLISVLAILGSVFVYVSVKEKWSSKSEQLLKTENKSFMANAYKSYKEKICFTISFKD